RWVGGGELFFALKGENFNGHEYVAAAFDKGAVAAVVDASFGSGGVSNKPVIIVEDTTRALGELAHLHRMKFKIPVIAVGGSNGKTTTKDMITSVLASTFKVLSTQGNLNNHIGVPQTLLRLEKKHKIAVIEIGTNHPGEIEHLCQIVFPTHGLITNVGREHLEFFKTVEGVAEEEGKLFDYLRRKTKSVVFVNADDPAVRLKAKRMSRQIVYGMHAKGVRVSGKQFQVDENGRSSIEYVRKKPMVRDIIHLRIPGEHNAMNALAAIAVGLTFKVPMRRIRKSLESFHPTTKRTEVLNLGDVSVINDTYNANPDSMISALRTLASTKVSGKKIAVLADMRELGERGKEEHAGVGREAARLGIDYVLTYGDLAREIHRAVSSPGALHYDQKNVLAEYLAELVTPGDMVLVKGSRGMKMEDIVTFLEERLRSASFPTI
ncbi:MAG TPA: UDP-N-acetylmuramoyl-tripeptide--D-alanyl-D-alanine ligase, partial [Bacteroidetes bacterium]|nr:UDP-N-acetylmuramoyl-tripeptide--D-alanyl-D-alanine ligase [Bacteroidota bacterium]